MMYGGLTRETGHIQRPHLSNRSITPEELEGLEAVLRLMERVADQVRYLTKQSQMTRQTAVLYFVYLHT